MAINKTEAYLMRQLMVYGNAYAETKAEKKAAESIAKCLDYTVKTYTLGKFTVITKKTADQVD